MVPSSPLSRILVKRRRMFGAPDPARCPIGPLCAAWPSRGYPRTSRPPAVGHRHGAAASFLRRTATSSSPRPSIIAPGAFCLVLPSGRVRSQWSLAVQAPGQERPVQTSSRGPRGRMAEPDPPSVSWRSSSSTSSMISWRALRVFSQAPVAVSSREAVSDRNSEAIKNSCARWP